MRYLLDTHAFVWWVTDDRRLPERVRTIIASAENEIFFSAASAWEIAIKAQLGRVTFARDPIVLIPQQIAANGFRHLPIDIHHALQVSGLPSLHRDPFDRLLVAQAMVEDLPLLSVDAAIAQYDIQIVW